MEKPLTPGVLLRQAREEAKLKVTDIAATLNLRACIVDAIESDDYSQFSELVFLKGYLRAYAHVLEIPTDKVMTAFDKLELWEPEREKYRWLPLSAKQVSLKDRGMRWLSYFIVGMLVTLVFIWWRAQKLPVYHNQPYMQMMFNHSQVEETIEATEAETQEANSEAAKTATEVVSPQENMLAKEQT